MSSETRTGLSDLRSAFRRAVRVLELTELPLRARVDLLYLAVAKRFLPRKEFVLCLPKVRLFFAANNLLYDQRTFDEIFIERCYLTDYQDAVVVDVGAHRGYFGAYALLHGAHSVLSYEPEQGNFAYLQQSRGTFLLSRSQWHVQRAAVGDQEGLATLYVNCESWAHTLIQQPATGQTRTEQVPMVSMKHILEQTSTKAGRRLIVKIDAEGAECGIVLNTPPDSWQAVDEVFVEMHDFSPCLAADIIEHFQRSGLVQKKARGGDIVHLRRIEVGV